MGELRGAEKEMQEDKILLQTTERLTKSGTWRLCLKSNTIEWSDGVFYMLGYDPSDCVLGFQFALEAIHPQDRDRAMEHIQDAIDGKSEYNIRKRLVGKHGVVIEVVSKASVIRDENGTAIRLVGVFQDITEFVFKKKELEAILDNSLDVICSMDAFGRFISVSRASVQVWGYQPHELIGTHYTELIHPDDLAKAEESLIQLKKQLKLNNYENRYRHKNGCYVTVFWSAYYVKSQERIYAVGRDVTEKNRTEDLLRMQERQFRSMIVGGGDLTAIFSENGKYKYVSPNYERILNYSEAELIGQSAFMHVHPEDAGRLKAEIKKISNKSRIVTSPYRYQSKAGGWRWIRSTLVNLLDDPAVKGYVSNSSDITDLIDANQKLRDSESRFRALYESQTNYVLRTDLSGRYTYVNKKFIEDFGWLYTDGEIIGANCLTSICDYDTAKVLRIVQKCIKDLEKPFKIEIDKPARDGGIMTTLWDFLCTTDQSGNPNEIQCIGIDITERVRFERNLMENNARYELINQATNDAIYDWDIENNSFHWGQSYYRIFDYPEGTAPRTLEEWETIQHPIDVTNNKDAWHAFLNDPLRMKWSEEFRWKKGKGTYAYVEEIGYLVRNEDGKPVRMVGVLRDITEQKIHISQQRIQQQISTIFKEGNSLHTSLEPLQRFLLDEGGFSVSELWLLGSENNLMNRVFCTVSQSVPFSAGKHAEKSCPIGHLAAGKVWEKQKALTWSQDSYFLAFPQEKNRITENKFTCLGVPLLDNDVVIGVLIFYSQESLSNISFKLEIFQNLGAFLAAEIKRKHQEEQMRSLFEYSPDILALASPAGYFRKVNPAFCQLLGYAEEELISQPFINLVHPEDVNATLNKFDETSNGKNAVENFVNRYRTKRGDYKYIAWGSSIPLGYERLLFSYGKDVTPLVKLQKMLQTASEMASVGAWELDLIKQEYSLSPMSRTIFGISANEVPTAEDAINYYHQDYRDTILQIVSESLATRAPFEYEALIITQDGTPKWIKAKGDIEYSGDTPVRIYGSIQDIHQQKLDKLAIEEALSERNTILESIGESFFSLDEDNKVLYWNKSAESLLQVPREQVVGENIWETVPSITKHNLKELCARAILDNNPLRLETHDVGTEQWLEVAIYPKNKKLSVFLRDISNRKRSEEEIRLSNERFQKITEATNDAIWDFNVPKNTLFWGKGFETLFGFDLNTVTPSLELLISRIHPNDRQGIIEKIERYMAPGYTHNLWQEEYRFQHADGTYAVVKDRAVFVRDALGIVTRVLGAMSDITSQKTYENSLKELNLQLKEKVKELALSNQELEQFAYVASHDLQEPLRMVTSFLGQIERKYSHLLDDKGKQYINFAVDGSRRMRQIILDLLEFSRVGRNFDQLEEVDLNEIVDETVLLFRKTIEESKAEVVRGNLPIIQSFQVPMRQIFQNLISNALKYRSPGRHPIIRIEAIDRHEAFEITIEDNGMGIEPEYFDKIFIIFQRLHKDSSLPGTGMGLAITKKIIENYGGTIWVSSIPGEGSKFHFTIPKTNPINR